ncbi:MAG: isochorismatase family protein [Proteobacteria bacterium]|nr:MAG: isochorismatase family protein [Pseudomonadota bacterium]
MRCFPPSPLRSLQSLTCRICMPPAEVAVEIDPKRIYVHRMRRREFPLSSDQLELLLAFGESKGLTALAERMGRDQSVISRGLQKIAEDYPLLVKIKGRWELTPLGLQVNATTSKTLSNFDELLSKDPTKPSEKMQFDASSVLIILNAQVGLLDATQSGRNNSDAEVKIQNLLTHWRSKKRPVIHVKHISENAGSLFFRGSAGSALLPNLESLGEELVLEKSKSSAFTDTDLENTLKAQEPKNLVLVGFTANECIDATAKDASALGFETYVAGDATAMFDLRGPDGKLLKAYRVHRLTLANINAFHAKVIETAELIS